MGKVKGSKAERELLYLFLSKRDWSGCRVAGSGCMRYPSPDLIVGNNKDSRILAIECKSLKKESKYFKEQEIKELREFSRKFGAESWLALRFDNIGWFFIKPEKLKKTKSNYYSISLEEIKRKGLNFNKLIGKNG